MKKQQQALELEGFLPYRLSLLSNTVSSTIASVYQDKFGISMVQWRIMAVLAEYPGSSADDVCQRTKMEKSVVSRAVARLLERYLINREFDQSDKRCSILKLSSTGQSVYAEVMPITESFEEKLLVALSTEERKSLSILLDKLQQQANIFSV